MSRNQAGEHHPSLLVAVPFFIDVFDTYHGIGTEFRRIAGGNGKRYLDFVGILRFIFLESIGHQKHGEGTSR
jgi:hypothetical protein